MYETKGHYSNRAKTKFIPNIFERELQPIKEELYYTAYSRFPNNVMLWSNGNQIIWNGIKFCKRHEYIPFITDDGEVKRQAYPIYDVVFYNTIGNAVSIANKYILNLIIKDLEQYPVKKEL